MTDHLANLNPPQREAVLHTDGPLLVLAGAGSGKTRVITYRIAHLIESGVIPHHILAVTFTNKAAGEMRERVRTILNERPNLAHATIDSMPTVTTFHSLGVRLLREHHERLDLKRHFVIYDRSDSVRAIKKALEKAGYSPKQFEPKRILSMISRAKGDALSRLHYTDSAASYPEQVAAEVWGHYETILRSEQALDFDDLLARTLFMLESHPDILHQLQERYRYLHVDEYQDTNVVQYKIVRRLAGETAHLCVVGDIDQMIYGWRGADIKNVLQFERHFPGAKTILLEENYRSTQTIIAASNDIISKNNNRVDKQVFTNNQPGEPIALYGAMSGIEEAEHVVMECSRLMKEGARPSDMAVLYRTNFQSRVLEEAFLQFGVPYQLLGTKFFERKEVKDILSYLRLALNPGSTSDLTRIINTPTRGIGKVTMLKVVEGKRSDLQAAAQKKVQVFDDLMSDITKVAQEKRLSEIITFIMKRSGYEADLKEQGEDGLDRLENLRELVTLATKYDGEDPALACEYVLEEAALQSDQDELGAAEQKDAVRLMTVHAAKGLEFPYVFVTGLEEGLFPHERIDSDGKIDHEEERRLFYVALTRAEKKVWLSFAHMRTIFGSQRINMPSSFLSDISPNLIEEHGPGSASSGSGETTIWLD